MDGNDFGEFQEAWTNAHENSANKSKLSDSQISYAFEMLEDFELPLVVASIKKHSREDRFAPTPADIIEIINSLMPQHPSPDEAWAMVPKFDSAEVEHTVVITAPAWEAWWKVANDYEVDKVSARKSFLEIYARIVSDWQNIKRAPEYKVHYGTDSNERKAQVIQDAITEGKLDARLYQEKLVQLAPSKYSSLQKMLEHKSKQEGLSEVAKEWLPKIKAYVEQMVADEQEMKRQRHEVKFNNAKVESRSGLPPVKPLPPLVMPADEEREFIRQCIEQSTAVPKIPKKAQNFDYREPTAIQP